jgi:hypothetical protein
MKSMFAKMALVALLAVTTALPAEAGGRRQSYYGNNNSNGWAAAAIGAVVGVAIGSAIISQQTPSYTYEQRNYVTQPQYYYAPQRACQPTQVPVYDQYGRIVQYRQVCN